jgi:hypothetical protein
MTLDTILIKGGCFHDNAVTPYVVRDIQKLAALPGVDPSAEFQKQMFDDT